MPKCGNPQHTNRLVTINTVSSLQQSSNLVRGKMSERMNPVTELPRYWHAIEPLGYNLRTVCRNECHAQRCKPMHATF